MGMGRDLTHQSYHSGPDHSSKEAEMEMGTDSMGEATDMTKDLDKLKTAKPFDKAFIDAMIPHHRMAVEAARLAEKRAEHPEIKKLARAIIEAQEREIKQLEEWRRSWYPGT